MGIIPIVDSDGDISVPAYWFEAAGLQGILPLERQAGVDLSRLRRDHPRMLFVGHFDKMTMAKVLHDHLLAKLKKVKGLSMYAYNASRVEL